jgi:hypothetical protein
VSNGVKGDVNERPFGHAPGHSRHDRLLVVRFAAGDTTGAETDEGRKLVEQCPDCANLAVDIKQLRTSLAAMPAAKRTRNFRLTREDAERLRGSAFDRFLRRLSMPSLGFVRPLAGVALALGLTITVVGSGLPSAVLAPVAGTAVQAPSETGQDSLHTVRELSSAAPLATSGAYTDGAPNAAASAPPPAPGATPPEDQNVATITSSDAPKATNETLGGQIGDEPSPPTAAADESTDTTRLLLIYGGVTLAMLAFALLLLTVYARRRTEDPLLR